jgi:hypothetical protein
MIKLKNLGYTIVVLLTLAVGGMMSVGLIAIALLIHKAVFL